MSHVVRNWVAEHGPRQRTERAVLLELADRADDGGECWPGIEDIADRTALHVRSVQRALRRLEVSGWITTKVGGGGGRGRRGDRRRTSTYRVLMVECPMPVTAEAEALTPALRQGKQPPLTPAACPVNPGSAPPEPSYEPSLRNADADASAAQRAARPQNHERIEATNSGHPQPEIIPAPKSERGGTHQQPAAGNRTRRTESKPRGGQPALDLGDGWSTGSGEAAPPFSAGRAIFDSGIRLLTSSGMREQQARRIIGRWRKSFPDIAILGALDSAARERPVDPVSWITATLRHRGDGANIINFYTKGSGHGQGQQQHHDFTDWHRSGTRDQRRRAYGPASQILAVAARLGYLD